MNKTKILIVDDRRENIYVLKNYLKRLDVEIIEALNGNDALKESLHHDFALAILDVQMPGMDGYELAEILHNEENTRFLPIIFLTAFSSGDDQLKKGYSTGAADFISKPYNPDVLISKVTVFIQLEEQRRKLKELNEQLENEIEKRKEIEENLKNKSLQLEELNNELEERVKNETEKRLQKEQMLIHQAKNAAMGEMIGAIAHQWKQPLNSLALIIQDIEDAFKYNDLNEESLKASVNDSMEQITFMSTTIDDFKNFFKKNKVQEAFCVVKAVNETASLVSSQLKSKDIELDFEQKEETDIFKVLGFKNELEQVILNIFTNAKDSIIESCNNQAGKISIEIKRLENNIQIYIADNGGGVPEEIQAKIFDPYFTTKDNTGTGIGLYMSKIIIEKNMNGKLSVANNENGAVFCIELAEHT